MAKVDGLISESTMEHRSRFSRIPLALLLTTICATHGAFVQNLYKKIESLQNFTGTIEARHTIESNDECAVRLVKFS